MSDLEYIEARSYNGGFSAGPNVRCVHSVESEIKAGLARSLATYWFGQQASTSAHTIHGPDESLLMVLEHLIAFHCGGGNPYTLGDEHLGRAAFALEQWLANGGDLMIRRTARRRYLEMTAKGIPWRWLSLAQLAAAAGDPNNMSIGGLCTHNDCRLVFGGTTHTDPGAGFPYAEYLAWGADGSAPPEGDEEDMAIVYQNPSGLHVADSAGYRPISEQATADNLIRAGAKLVSISLTEHLRWLRSMNTEHLPRIIVVGGQSDPDWPGIWALDASGYHHVGSMATVDMWRAKGADEDTITRAEHDEWVRQVGVPA